jgi:hypothetical protein
MIGFSFPVVGDVIPITTPGMARSDGTHVWPVTVRGLYRYRNPEENSRNILTAAGDAGRSAAHSRGVARNLRQPDPVGLEFDISPPAGTGLSAHHSCTLRREPTPQLA